jgi:hypothetical protein
MLQLAHGYLEPTTAPLSTGTRQQNPIAG